MRSFLHPRQSSGKLKFDAEVPKLYVEVDPEIVHLTRALLPQPLRSDLKPQRHAPHISVVRNEPIPICSSEHVIHFTYDAEPIIGDIYAWLVVRSEELTQIRLRLGLPPSSEWSRPPDGEDCYHVTIGNRK